MDIMPLEDKFRSGLQISYPENLYYEAIARFKRNKSFSVMDNRNIISKTILQLLKVLPFCIIL